MITPEDRQEMACLIGVNPMNVEPPVIELIDRLIGVRRNEGEDAFRRKLSDLLRVPDRDVDHAKLATHLQETNDVLISRIRSLEIKLEKAEKALAVEREACAKVAESLIGPLDDDWAIGINHAAESIAQIIRGRGEK
jgi:hypothetical protein